MKTTSYNEKKYAFNLAPRCGAKTKNNNGKPCKNPAVRGKKRCRLHGGAKGSGAKIGNTNALRHGYSTQNVKHLKKVIKLLLNTVKS